MGKKAKPKRTAANGQAPLVAGARLEKELKFYGCDMDPGQFNDLLAEMHHNMHPAWNPEQLLYHPTYGATFVKAIRARSSDTLPEEMILRRLRNMQKAGSMSS